MGERLDPAMLQKMQILLDQVIADNEVVSPGAPEHGSVIRALDQRIGDPYLLSHAFSGAVAVARDLLVTLQRLIYVARVATTWGSMTLARGALENAATAFWFLSAADPDERCTRTLQHAATSLVDERRFYEHFSTVASPEPGLRRELARGTDELHKARRELLLRAERLGLDRERVSQNLRWATILDTVGEESGQGSGAIHVQWKLLSGLAHGRQYAALKGLDHQIVSHSGKSATAMFTVNEDLLYTAVGTSCLLLRRAVDTYEQDRRNPARGASFLQTE